MPQDEQNRLWEQESLFCMENLGAVRFHHCCRVCRAFCPHVTSGQLILPRAGHSQSSALLEKLITAGPGLREFLAGVPMVWWSRLSKTVPATESKRGQEKRLCSLIRIILCFHSSLGSEM